MKNDWKPGGPLIDVLANLSAAVKIGPQIHDGSAMAEFRALNAWTLVREAYEKLDAVRLEAIRRGETNYIEIAIANVRVQAAAVTDPEKLKQWESSEVADELAEEERINRLIVAREGSL